MRSSRQRLEQQLREAGYRIDGDRAVLAPPPEPELRLILGDRPPCPKRAGPELALSCALARTLDPLALAGRLRAVWSATEAAVPVGGVRGLIAQQRLRAAGVNAGWSDFVFGWSDGSGLLELKAGGSLRPAQQAVRAWCERLGVRHGVARSVEEALDHLRAWGRLD